MVGLSTNINIIILLLSSPPPPLSSPLLAPTPLESAASHGLLRLSSGWCGGDYGQGREEGRRAGILATVSGSGLPDLQPPPALFSGLRTLGFVFDSPPTPDLSSHPLPSSKSWAWFCRCHGEVQGATCARGYFPTLRCGGCSMNS